MLAKSMIYQINRRALQPTTASIFHSALKPASVISLNPAVF